MILRRYRPFSGVIQKMTPNLIWRFVVVFLYLQHNCKSTMKATNYTFSVLFFSALHLVCCLLPWLVPIIGLSAMAHWGNEVAKYQPYLFGIQAVLIAWMLYRVFFNDTKTYLIRDGILLTTLVVSFGIGLNLHRGKWFLTEQEKITSVHFERVISTRQIQLDIKKSDFVLSTFKNEIGNVEGVIASQIKGNDSMVSLRYDFRKIDKADLIQQIRDRGYYVREIQN